MLPLNAEALLGLENAICCFPPTGNRGCGNTILVKLAACGIAQTKTKTDIPTRFAQFKVE